MDETLRVRIIADTVQASSSLKSLNKETQGLGTGTNSANAAVEKLNRSLNSIGFKSVQLNNLAIGFDKLKNESQRFSGAVKKAFEGISFRKFSSKLDNTKKYFSDWEKKAPEAAKKIENALNSIKGAMTTAQASDKVLDASGLAEVRRQVKELVNSRNKYIKQVFNEDDFEGMKDNLMKAAIAAAKGSKEEYIESLARLSTGDILTPMMNRAENSFFGVMDRIKVKVKSTSKALKESFISALKAVDTAAWTIFKSGVIAAIVAAITAIKNAFNVTKLGDDIDKTSQKVGMSTDAYQKWGYILERCGIQVSQLQTAMRQLTRKTSNDSDVFKQLGIDTSGKTQQKIFEETVEALQKVPDSAQRATMAYKVFGTSASELAPLLNTSSQEIDRLSYQYDLLGAKMSGNVIRASADMQDAITDLKSAFQGLKNTLAQYLIPLLTKAIVELTVFVTKVNMVLQSLFGVEAGFEHVEESTADIGSSIAAANTEAKKLKTLISGFDELNIFPSQSETSGIADVIDDLDGYVISAPTIGEILPPEAIAELERFRTDVLPGIVDDIHQIKLDLETIDSILSGKKWQLAFDTGNIKDLTFGDIFGDFIGQLFRGINNLFAWNQDGEGIKGLFKEWFPMDIDWDENWFSNWLSGIWGGTPTEAGLKQMFGIDKIESWDIWKASWWSEIWEGIKKPFVDFGNWIGDWNIWKGSWWSQKWEDFKHNINPKHWLIGDEDAQGLLDIMGLGGIKDWDIWKASWWSGLWDKLSGNYNSASINSTKKVQTAQIGLMPMLGLANVAKWDIWKSDWWKERWEGLKKGWEESSIIQFFVGAWAAIKLWFNTSVKPIFTGDFWKEKFGKITEGLKNTTFVGQIILTWNSIKSWVKEKIFPVFNSDYWKGKFDTIRSGLAKIDLKQAAKDVFNKLIEKVESAINKLADAINNSGISNLLRKLNVNVNLGHVSIPRLAKGGVVSQETLAIVGEYPGAASNPEIITPESKMQEVFENSNQDIVNVLLQGFRQIIQAIDEKDTSVQIGDSAIARAAARGNTQYRLQTGQSLF